MRTWVDPFFDPDLQAAAERLAQELGLHPLAAQLLARRGYVDPEAARAFLDPEAYQPAPPETLPGVAAAVARLLQALEQGETILVWGDFDVDGQTATALLVGVLGGLGGRVRYHIPVRAVESHGVGLPVLRQLLAETPAPQVLLTCDTGIADFDALAYAQAAGLAVIVTDHHALSRPAAGRQPDDQHVETAPGAYQLPPALAVVTPRLLPDDHPLAGLPGVGVAYKLAEAVCARRGQPGLAAAQLDLVALGIVADVALQTGDTRYLLQQGLRYLNRTPRAGLQAVFAQAGLQPGRLTEEDISFALAPRLNALGRLSDANPAVELLTTPDAGRARLLAVQLEGFNARRQLLTGHTLQSALGLIKRQPEVLRSPVLVLAHPTWEPGVIGIVASRLVELYGRPVVLFAAPPNQPARGSARSIEGVDITAAIAATAAAVIKTAAAGTVAGKEAHPPHPGLVLAFGGHPMAAGLSLPAENIPEFARRLAQVIRQQRLNLPVVEPSSPPLVIDAYLPWQALDQPLAEALERLAPFGPGNPAPVLASRDLHLVGRSPVGRSRQHLAVTLADAAGLARRVIWWGGAELVGIASQAGSSKAGADEGAPESLEAALPLQAVLDLAYSLRQGAAGAAAGLQIEWLDARLKAAEAQEPAGPELVDLRRSTYPLDALRGWLAQAGYLGKNDLGAWQIWAEADGPQKLEPVLAGWLGGAAPGGPLVRQRHQLSACNTLIIWTAPPGRAELLAALERAQPQRVVVVGVTPPFAAPQLFLERLAGLVKYALGAENGALDLERLAAALAQRTPTVRRGLAWLAGRGAITLQEPAYTAARAAVLFAAAGGEADPARAAAAFEEARLLLEEAKAYRAHFARAQGLG